MLSPNPRLSNGTLPSTPLLRPGIVNGMDISEWSPARDKFLAFKYNADTAEAGKVSEARLSNG